MMTIEALEQAENNGVYVWFPNNDGKIVCGLIYEINVRTRTTASVMLKDVKYNPNDIKTVACIRNRENCHIYMDSKQCAGDFYVRQRQTCMDSIKSSHDLYLFVRRHNLDKDQMAASVALEKSYELDLIRNADTQTNPNTDK